MANNDPSRAGARTLANMSRSITKIIGSALVAGPKGAAVSAIKETLPFWVKLAVGIGTAVFVIPMLVFTAMPNIFFGYDNSNTEAVAEMTDQALIIGGAYMSLETFEKTHVDSVVTGIAASYEAEGTSIDKIELRNTLSEEDLLWIIAINSTAHQQDLNTMSADSVRDFFTEQISLSPALGVGSDDTAVLTVTIDELDPDAIMDKLGFDDEAKTWAGALFETLEESDALNTYADHFAPYIPSYSGDTGYTGGVEYGDGYGNEIDISGFVSPGTKNNLDLVAYAIQAWENQWGYVWGTFGAVLTESLFAYKLEQYPSGVGNYANFIEENWLGRRTADCVGLIKGYGWLDADSLTIGYATNGMPDYSADQMYSSAEALGTDYGSMDTMPEIPGLALWKSGHIGVYIGDGYAIEAMGTKYGVVKTQVAGRGWAGWCKLPYIQYIE